MSKFITLVLINSCEFTLLFTYGDFEHLLDPDLLIREKIEPQPSKKVRVQPANTYLYNFQPDIYEPEITADIALECRCYRGKLHLSLRAGGVELVC